MYDEMRLAARASGIGTVVQKEMSRSRSLASQSVCFCSGLEPRIFTRSAYTCWSSGVAKLAEIVRSAARGASL